MQAGILPPEWEPTLNYNQVDGGMMPLQTGQFGNDAQLSVRFVLVPEIDHLKTIEAGYEVFQYHEYVNIQRPGDKTFVFFQRASLSHKARFPYQYQAFKEGKAFGNIGIPIEVWDYQLSETQIYTLKLLGVNYVHQIATMSDVQQLSLGLDARDMVARAKISTAKLETREANASLQKQLEDYKREMDALRAKLEEREANDELQIARFLAAKQNAEEKEYERAQRQLESAVSGVDGATEEISEIMRRGRGRPKRNA